MTDESQLKHFPLHYFIKASSIVQENTAVVIELSFQIIMWVCVSSCHVEANQRP